MVLAELKKRREHTKLSLKRGQKFAIDQSDASTDDNFSKMYDDVYHAMVACGIAEVLQCPIYMDSLGKTCST